MRRRSCFAARVRVIFKRCFLKTNFFPEYSNKNSHNSHNFCSIDTKFGTTTDKFPQIQTVSAKLLIACRLLLYGSFCSLLYKKSYTFIKLIIKDD